MYFTELEMVYSGGYNPLILTLSSYENKWVTVFLFTTKISEVITTPTKKKKKKLVFWGPQDVYKLSSSMHTLLLPTLHPETFALFCPVSPRLVPDFPATCARLSTLIIPGDGC